MIKVGDKVTRKGSAKVWEVAEIATAAERNAGVPENLIIKWYGALDAPVAKLKNPETGKAGKNCWWKLADLTLI